MRGLLVEVRSETRYYSKLWNPEFLRNKGLPVPAWLEVKR
jgi:cysteine synthase